MALSWTGGRFEDVGVPVFPLVLGATRADWIVRCSLANWFPWPMQEIRVQKRLTNRCAALAPVILGHLSEPGIADASSGVYLAGEPLMGELHQERGWEQPIDVAAVSAEAQRLLDRHGSAVVCWLLTEPAWDMLAGAGDPGRPRVEPDEAATQILAWIGAVRAVDPGVRPILWAESAVSPGSVPGWTLGRVLRTMELVGEAVQIHAATAYMQDPESTDRPWWWDDVPGPLGLVETGWLPYDWSERTADPRRLERARWRLPRAGERSYPECADQADRLARWQTFASGLAREPRSVVTGYYAGVSHGGGERDIARPWGLLAHPWAQERRDRWLPVGPVREALAAIRAEWRA